MYGLSLMYDGRKVGFCRTMQIGDVCAVVDAAEPEAGAQTWTLQLRNTGEHRSGQLTEVRSADLSLPFDGVAVYESLSGDSCGEESFRPVRRELCADSVFHAEPSGGRSSNTTAFPYFDVQTGGRTYIFAIGWSGQWSLDIRAEGDVLSVCVGLCDCDFYLEPGEEVLLPSMLMMEGGADAAALRRRFRALLRGSFSPAIRLGEKMRLPASIQCFDRYAGRHPQWATEAGQRFCADRAAALGLDTLWLDAAWFRGGFPNGVGNYEFAEGFPNGLRPVSEYAHEKGLRFMLWVEPERVHEDTEVDREHPEFLLRLDREDGAGKCPDSLYDLGNPAAFAWLRDRLIGLIEENGVDCYRQDFNIDPLPFWRRADRPDRRGITEMKYIEGLYRLWDAIIGRFPAIFIDNCSSGGRRIDFETCKRSVPMWRSDTGCSPASAERPSDLWNQNQTLALTRYLPYHSCAVWTENAYAVRSVETDGLAYNFDIYNDGFHSDAAAAVIREQMRLAKYWKGAFYPLTAPTLSETGWAGWRFVLPDCGCALLFRRHACAEEAFTLFMPELDPAGRFRVTLTDESLNRTVFELSGAELSSYTVRLPQPAQSAVLEYAALHEAVQG